MMYSFDTEEKITNCESCPCNYLDGHENFCKLTKKFNLTRKSKECPLVEYDIAKWIGGTTND